MDVNLSTLSFAAATYFNWETETSIQKWKQCTYVLWNLDAEIHFLNGPPKQNFKLVQKLWMSAFDFNFNYSFICEYLPLWFVQSCSRPECPILVICRMFQIMNVCIRFLVVSFCNYVPPVLEMVIPPPCLEHTVAIYNFSSMLHGNRF